MDLQKITSKFGQLGPRAKMLLTSFDALRVVFDHGAIPMDPSVIVDLACKVIAEQTGASTHWSCVSAANVTVWIHSSDSTTPVFGALEETFQAAALDVYSQVCKMYIAESTEKKENE